MAISIAKQRVRVRMYNIEKIEPKFRENKSKVKLRNILKIDFD